MLNGPALSNSIGTSERDSQTGRQVIGSGLVQVRGELTSVQPEKIAKDWIEQCQNLLPTKEEADYVRIYLPYQQILNQVPILSAVVRSIIQYIDELLNEETSLEDHFTKLNKAQARINIMYFLIKTSYPLLFKNINESSRYYTLICLFIVTCQNWTSIFKELHEQKLVPPPQYMSLFFKARCNFEAVAPLLKQFNSLVIDHVLSQDEFFLKVIGRHNLHLIWKVYSSQILLFSNYSYIYLIQGKLEDSHALNKKAGLMVELLSSIDKEKYNSLGITKEFATETKTFKVFNPVTNIEPEIIELIKNINELSFIVKQLDVYIEDEYKEYFNSLSPHTIKKNKLLEEILHQIRTFTIPSVTAITNQIVKEKRLIHPEDLDAVFNAIADAFIPLANMLNESEKPSPLSTALSLNIYSALNLGKKNHAWLSKAWSIKDTSSAKNRPPFTETPSMSLKQARKIIKKQKGKQKGPEKEHPSVNLPQNNVDSSTIDVQESTSSGDSSKHAVSQATVEEEISKIHTQELATPSKAEKRKKKHRLKRTRLQQLRAERLREEVEKKPPEKVENDFTESIDSQENPSDPIVAKILDVVNKAEELLQRDEPDIEEGVAITALMNDVSSMTISSPKSTFPNQESLVLGTRIFVEPTARTLLYRLEEAGYWAFIYGGYVRDSLSLRKPYDVDIYTNCPKEKLAQILRSLFGNGFSCNSEHSYRFHVLGYIDISCPDAMETGQLEEFISKLQRCDLTINGFCADWRGNIYAFLGHIDHLTDNFIRFAGANSHQLFKEDPTLITRSIRIANHLGKKILPEDILAIQLNASLLTTLKWKEYLKQLKALFLRGEAVINFKFFVENRILGCLLPNNYYLGLTDEFSVKWYETIFKEIDSFQNEVERTSFDILAILLAPLVVQIQNKEKNFFPSIVQNLIAAVKGCFPDDSLISLEYLKEKIGFYHREFLQFCMSEAKRNKQESQYLSEQYIAQRTILPLNQSQRASNDVSRINQQDVGSKNASSYLKI